MAGEDQQKAPPDTARILNEIQDLKKIASLTDEANSRSVEDNGDKEFTFKVFGNPTDSLYLSGSLMRNGNTGRSAFQFGGSRLR